MNSEIFPACHYFYSGSGGIEKIRAGATDLTTSVINSLQVNSLQANSPQETELATDTDIATDTLGVSKYATVKTAKYLTLAIGIFCGLFTATLIGAGVIGLLGGILFSPEIASVPVLADAAVAISSSVSELWNSLIAKLADR